MNPVTMSGAAIGLLVLAAAGGLLMAGLRLKSSPIPHWLAMAHGFLAAAALTLLIYAAVVAGLQPLALGGLALLALAGAAGVFLNLRYQTRNLQLPFAFVALHGVVAAAGLVMLVLAALGR